MIAIVARKKPLIPIILLVLNATLEKKIEKMQKIKTITLVQEVTANVEWLLTTS